MYSLFVAWLFVDVDVLVVCGVFVDVDVLVVSGVVVCRRRCTRCLWRGCLST